jgi:predicted ATPase
VEGPEAGEPAAALQLLLQRVRQQQPDVVFDAAARADAAAICRALDGLPLALELAAARVPLLGWAGVRSRLVERLEGRLSLLTRGAADAASRHRTLRAALAWTHGLLAPAEQQVLAALSVFAGGFTLAAAVAVAGPDDA